MVRAYLGDSNLSGVDLRKVNLKGADLFGTILRDVNFEGTVLRAVDLSHTDLTGANLVRADLSNANLQHSLLYGADFQHARMERVDLRGANAYRTSFVSANLEKAQAMYAANGITTMVDAPMEPGVFKLYKRAADQGLFRLDLISYCGDQDLAELVKEGFDFGQEYKGYWRVPGVKTFIDGSPQGKTAFFTEPFLTGGPGGEKDYRGEFMVSQDKLN